MMRGVKMRGFRSGFKIKIEQDLPPFWPKNSRKLAKSGILAIFEFFWAKRGIKCYYILICSPDL